MEDKIEPISLNEILKIDGLENVKIRFNLMIEGNWNPTDIFRDGDSEKLLAGQYWNYKKNKSFKEGQITIGLLKVNASDSWLLFHVGRVTKDLNKFDSIGYEYETLPEYEKYCGRLIVKYKNSSQNMIRLATSVMKNCEVGQILPDRFDNDIFPGYDFVKLSWNELSRVIEKEGWKAALQNQKGVYLITDTSNGKMYVGSAYGENMILGRWKSYVKTGHGGNEGLKGLSKEYICKYFEYSILDIFKATTDDHQIILRETWWKNILKTKIYGYNKN
ncbi:GIY-YIG nuclease family protein [Tateyamaria sp.]|nr:GIY-YIG nuclease family protein [Tateyamaria sp.]